jgi:hypothetical protein
MAANTAASPKDNAPLAVTSDSTFYFDLPPAGSALENASSPRLAPTGDFPRTLAQLVLGVVIAGLFIAVLLHGLHRPLLATWVVAGTADDQTGGRGQRRRRPGSSLSLAG